MNLTAIEIIRLIIAIYETKLEQALYRKKLTWDSVGIWPSQI